MKLPAFAVLSLALAIASPQCVAEELDLTGLWVTNIGVLELQQDGDTFEGTFNGGGTVTREIVDGKTILRYENGKSKGRLTVSVDEDGSTLSGTYGSRGKLRGWRQNPQAASEPQADFSGLWLTSKGTMQIKQDGQQVSGPYGAQGRSSITGTVDGARLKCTWKHIKSSGPAWFEMSADGKRLFGATIGDRPSVWTGIRVNDFAHHVTPQAGKIVKGHADNGMLYHLRMPDDWQPGTPLDVVVLLHGSNWTTAGMVFVVNKNWPHIGKKFAILGIQGERWADWSKADDLRFNYSYQNWTGRSTYKGFPYTDRESPYLVAQVIDELSEAYQLERVLLGGHSQGGFLTYMMHMHFPKKLAGTFPVAGGLIFQAEPSAFDDDELIAQQRDTPMVIVHGKKDRVVRFSTSEYIRGRFAAYDFPKVKLLSPDLGHPFDFLPIGPAIDWLDVMSTNDHEALLAFCEDRLAGKQWRELGAALQRAHSIDQSKAFEPFTKAYEQAASAEANQHLAAIKANENSDWVDPYLDWQEQFSLAKVATEVRAAYQQLRGEHQPEASKLYNEARKAFRSGDRDSGWKKYRLIVENYYASPRFRSLRDLLVKENK